MNWTAGLTLITFLLAQPNVKGDIAPPGSVVSRFCAAECVVVGKVTEIEEKTVKVTYPGGKDLVEFKVGVVKIEHLGKGGEKGLTHVKVCFLPPTDAPIRRPRAHLKVNQEVVLFLQKHPTESYYFCPGFYGQVTRGESADNYDSVVTQVKQCQKFSADPDAGLKSKDARERLLTTALLLSTYRKAQKVKAEEFSAEQSKLMLQTLLEADWQKLDPVLGWDLAPYTLFLMLGLTRDDGWTLPTQQQDHTAEAKKWLKANAEKYRVKKYVK